MNKNITILVVIILAVLVGGIYTMGKNEQVTTHSGSLKSTESQMMQKNTDVMMKAGSYESYAPEKLIKAADGQVVLFFRARWCSTCNGVHSDIEDRLSEIPEKLTILDVDYDDSSPLKAKYGVTYQHTFVQVDKDGKMIKKWSGSPTLKALISEVK